MTGATIPVGPILFQAGLIDATQLISALAHQECWGGSLEEAILDLGFVSESKLLEHVSRRLGMQYVQIGSRWLPKELVSLLPEKLLRARKVFPVAWGPRHGSKKGVIFVATADPLNLPVLDEVAFVTGLDVKPVLATERDVLLAIDRHFEANGAYRYGVSVGRGDSATSHTNAA